MELSGLDIGVYFFFILAVTGIGFWVGRGKAETVDEYFLAGNRIPWFAIGVSIIAASISTEQFLGEVGFAYQHGLAVANWEWANFIAQLILAFIFIPIFLRQRIITIPEYLARRIRGSPGNRFAFSSDTAGFTSRPPLDSNSGTGPQHEYLLLLYKPVY